MSNAHRVRWGRREFQQLFCPSCGEVAAQADDEATSGFSRAHKRGRVQNRSYLLVVTCACGYGWTVGRMRPQEPEAQEPRDGEL